MCFLHVFSFYKTIQHILMLSPCSSAVFWWNRDRLLRFLKCGWRPWGLMLLQLKSVIEFFQPLYRRKILSSLGYVWPLSWLHNKNAHWLWWKWWNRRDNSHCTTKIRKNNRSIWMQNLNMITLPKARLCFLLSSNINAHIFKCIHLE